MKNSTMYFVTIWLVVMLLSLQALAQGPNDDYLCQQCSVELDKAIQDLKDCSDTKEVKNDFLEGPLGIAIIFVSGFVTATAISKVTK